MVKIRDLIWYERLNEDKPYWFINSVNYEIVNIAEILEKLDIDDNYFITYCYDYDYVPLPVVDYGEIAKEYGVMPCVHPHYNTTIMREHEIDFIMQNTDPNVIGFGPDTAHLAAGNCNVADVLERYKDRIKFMHLKDLKGALESGGMQAGVEVYSSFRELGNGDIDFDSVFRVLKDANFNGYLCCELDRSRYGNKLSALLNKMYLEEHWNK